MTGLVLGVAARAETFERLRDLLGERGIRVRHLSCTERVIDLWDPGYEPVDVGWVYPSRLTEGGVVDAAVGIPWVNDRAAVLKSRNKAGVIARLGRAGVPVPRTVLVSSPVAEQVLAEVFQRVGPPVVVKPTTATHGAGITKVHDLDSFLGVAEYFGVIHGFEATGDRSFLVQEFLPGARDYRAMVIDGTYQGAVERRLPEGDGEGEGGGRWKRNVHRDARADPIRLGGRERAIAERAAGVLGIPVVGVDLLVSGDRVVVGETNARPTVDAVSKYEPGFVDAVERIIRNSAASKEDDNENEIGRT